MKLTSGSQSMPVCPAFEKVSTQAFHKWLGAEENANRWYDNMERRILITHWTGEAYAKLIGAEYDNFGKKLVGY